MGCLGFIISDAFNRALIALFPRIDASDASDDLDDLDDLETLVGRKKCKMKIPVL